MGGKLKKISIKTLRVRLEDLTGLGRAHDGAICLL